MQGCRKCGGELKRVRRSYLQRLGCAAIFACPDCQYHETVPRFSYRLGDVCRCPRCGTTRLSRLRERDYIDKMDWGLWNLAARLCGGKLYHCWFCRLQFYDRRPLPEIKEPEAFADPNSAKSA